MQPEKSNPYDFIMQPSQPQKGKKVAGPPSNTKSILTIVIFVVAVLALIIGGLAIFQTLNKPKTGDLVDLVAHQTEIIRVTDLGLKDVRDENIRAKVQTLQTFMYSDLSRVNGLIAKSGTVVTEIQLARYFDKKVEDRLTTALQNNSLDSELEDILNQKLVAYSKVVETSLSTAKTKTKKDAMSILANNLIIYSRDK